MITTHQSGRSRAEYHIALLDPELGAVPQQQTAWSLPLALEKIVCLSRSSCELRPMGLFCWQKIPVGKARMNTPIANPLSMMAKL